MINSQIFRDAISEKRLYNVVKEVSSFHRIQASPMFKKAAERVVEIAKGYGLNVKMLNYEADPDVWYLENKMFKEWCVTEATLDLVDPEIRLSDYTAEPISVVQKSYPIDLRETPVDLVLLDKGPDKKQYKGVDLKNKWVFVRGAWMTEFDWIFDEGALGLITDHINENENRSRSDLYESLTYTSYWHTHVEGETEKRGFVLSPKMGDKLAAMIKKKWDEEKAYLQVRPYINSSLYNGHIQDVEVTIPGKDDKIVYLCAHLCHPKTSANDNASGVSATLEAMNVINTLVKEGKIEQPQHTIKLTLIPEFTGTYAYLSDHKNYKKALGAMNLDMVGGKQGHDYGPINLTKTPLSTPSMINELSTYALGEAAKQAFSLSGDALALTNHRVEGFSGGSDHTVYSDPSINIPCCMLGQWPDLNYHTATDKLEVIDPQTLKFSSMTAAVFAYTLATLTEADLPFLYAQLDKNMVDEKDKMVREYLDGKIDKTMLGSLMFKYEKYYLDCVKSVKKLVGNVSTKKAENHVRHMFSEWINYFELEDNFDRYEDLTKVYKRDFVGPVQQLSDYRAIGYAKEIDAFDKKASLLGDKHAMHSITNLVTYYIDGKRTLGEVVREVSLDNHCDCREGVLLYAEVLEAVNLIKEC